MQYTFSFDKKTISEFQTILKNLTQWFDDSNFNLTFITDLVEFNGVLPKLIQKCCESEEPVTAYHIVDAYKNMLQQINFTKSDYEKLLAMYASLAKFSTMSEQSGIEADVFKNIIFSAEIYLRQTIKKTKDKAIVSRYKIHVLKRKINKRVEKYAIAQKLAVCIPPANLLPNTKVGKTSKFKKIDTKLSRKDKVIIVVASLADFAMGN